jgi:AcrR family transcriptional regulator
MSTRSEQPGSAPASGNDNTDPPARLRRPRRAEVRERLLTTALTVFTERGYDGSTLDQVAAAAGFSKGAVYSNFASKDELFLALMDRQVEGYLAQIRTVLHGTRDDSWGRQAGDALTGMLTQDRGWQLLFLDYVGRASRDPRMHAHLAAHRACVRDLVADAVRDALGEDPGPDGLDLPSIAVTLLALSNGLAIERFIDPDAVPDVLLGTILNTLQRPADPREITANTNRDDAQGKPR